MKSEDRQTIYVAAYPKSGSTWLTRLLGDVLNSPTGGCMLEQDNKEVATEGQDRPGNYIVRKGHFVLIDDYIGQVVPSPHRLAWKQLTNEKIVFLVRDPRDICVSGAWHWRCSVEVFMNRMIVGDVARCGRWDEYCKDWSEFNIVLDNGFKSYRIIKYEDLLVDAVSSIQGLIFSFGIGVSLYDIEFSVENQSFSNRKSQIGNNPQELRRNNMRKGIAGDWKNHFTPQMNDRMWSEFGWMMEKLGYEK